MGPGDHGTVVEVRVFNRHGIEKDERALQNERHEIERLSRDRDDGIEILERNIYSRLNDLLIDKKINDGPKGAAQRIKNNSRTCSMVFLKGIMVEVFFEGRR